jgi:hypothetical protein
VTIIRGLDMKKPHKLRVSWDTNVPRFALVSISEHSLYYAVTENRYIDISKAKRMMNDKGSLDRVGISPLGENI